MEKNLLVLTNLFKEKNISYIIEENEKRFTVPFSYYTKVRSLIILNSIPYSIDNTIDTSINNIDIAAASIQIIKVFEGIDIVFCDLQFITKEHRNKLMGSLGVPKKYLDTKNIRSAIEEKLEGAVINKNPKFGYLSFVIKEKMIKKAKSFCILYNLEHEITALRDNYMVLMVWNNGKNVRS